MNSKTILAGLLFLLLTGCKSKSAFNYSEEMIKKERSLIPHIEVTESKVEKFAAKEQFDSVAAVSANMENMIQVTIDEIKSTPPPKVKEADNFKRAMLKYFQYIKSLYTNYKNWGNAETVEERDVIVLAIQKLVRDKEKVITEMQAAQRKYADVNGFKLEK